MWKDCFWYLRIFEDYQYLSRMILDVMYEMRYFTIIFMIAIFGFAQAFYYVSNQSDEEHQFINTWFDAFRFSFLTALGNF